MPATSSRCAGLQETRPPATRCAIRQARSILERMEFPDPVIEIAVEPKTKADQEKLGVALHRWRQEDPSFRVSTDRRVRPDHHQGHGRAASRHHRRHRMQARATRSRPMSASRRSPIARRSSRRSRIDYTHKKQTGGSGQFARVKLAVEPQAPGTGFEFENKVVGGTVPKEYVPGVREGPYDVGAHLRRARRLPGRRLSRSALIDGAYHDVDSRAHGLRDRRARRACAKALPKAGPELLEPIMKVEVVTPEDYIGVGDRRPQSAGAATSRVRTRAATRSVINAMVPLANMFGYVNTLRSMSQGRGAIHHAVRPLRAGTAGGGAGGPGEVRLIGQPETGLKGKTESPDGQSEIRSGPSRTAISGRSVMSTMARRR